MPFRKLGDVLRVTMPFDLEKNPGRTHQSQRDECDINKMMAKYQRGGDLPNFSGLASFGDFADAPDYHTAFNQIRQAGEAFLRLPVDLRSRFENKPERLIEFLADPGNDAESRDLGLRPPYEEKIVPTPPISAENSESTPTGGEGDSPPD